MQVIPVLVEGELPKEVRLPPPFASSLKERAEKVGLFSFCSGSAAFAKKAGGTVVAQSSCMRFI